jgi:ubiquinone/menaquinone biosynthesis C-methylase UbiE
VSIKYDNHGKEWEFSLNDEVANESASTWLDINSHTLNNHRYKRVFNLILPLIEIFPSATWLTVGDGRFGQDARILKTLGAKSIHCSDMDTTLLKYAYDRKIIDHYSEENAEFLSFEDDCFDFILCKESYHHFPRPYVALGEMMRVARKGVLLIEPRDHFIDRAPLHFLMKFLSKIFWKTRAKSSHGHEPVGNYAYCLSEREMEKFQLGMHRRIMLTNGINDYYKDGFEFCSMTSPSLSELIKIYKFHIAIFLKNTLELVGLTKSGLLVVLLAKDDFPNLNKLENSGYKLKILPKNPYL